jgi:RimJ/RimL family protein N-acetyltransferase
MILSKKSEINIRPVKVQDLELMLAWRSNPEVYKHFRSQDEPLSWQEHVKWFSSRPDHREDFIIEYKGRRVGSVFIDENNYIGLYIGEIEAQGQGIGETALEWVVDEFGKERVLKAEIHEENDPSRNLFEKKGFNQEEIDGNWVQYGYE